MIAPNRVALNRICSAGLLLLILSGASVSAAIAEKREFKIEAQDAATALTEFGRQAGVQILFEYDLVKGHRTNAVSGELEPKEAIRLLVEGTGLRISEMENGVLVVEAGQHPPRKAATNQPYTLAQNDSRAAQVAQAEQPAATAPQTTPRAEGPKEGTNLVDIGEVVVTGTHIRGAYPRSAPFSIYDRGDISRTGAATTDQFLRTLPQNLSSTDPTANAVPQQDPIQSQGNAFHGGGINIHGLGFNTTLVLLNGHRVAPGGSNGSFSDVTLIPLNAVERIEVLSSGASAIYGADAVAGVVNFVMRNDFDGVEATARYGESTEGGGQEWGASLGFGGSWDSGNVLGFYDHLDQSGLMASEREYVSPDVGTRALIPGGERHSVFLTAAQRVSPSVQLRADAFYSDRDYVDDSVTFGGLFVTHTEGRVTQRGLVPSATISLSGDWKADIAGNVSRLEQATVGTSDFDLFNFHSVFSRDRVTEVSSLDIVADGPLWSLRGGEINGAVGIAGKIEKVEDFSVNDGLTGLDTDAKRDSYSVFGELRVPVIGPANARAFAERLELSIAGRYDRYDQGGSKTTPQAGLSWSPADGVNIRGTYGQSFRVPTLEQLVGAPNYFVFPIPNPASPSGTTVTIVDGTAFNEDLDPEHSTAYTLGFDLDPNLVPNLSLSATYFRIKFKDRIAQPLARGGLFNLYNELDQLGPFVQFNPSQADVDAYFASGFMTDPFGVGSSNVGAIFDTRFKNLAESISEGIDMSARYAVDRTWGQVGLFMNGSYLLELSYQSLPTTPSVDVVDTIYNPPSLKLRGGMDWKRGSLRASFAVNYADSYTNTLVTPNEPVDSWTTGDIQLGYDRSNEPAAGSLANFSALLSIANITDERPPQVATPPIFVDVGYDPVNATPLGRFVSLQLTVRW